MAEEVATTTQSSANLLLGFFSVFLSLGYHRGSSALSIGTVFAARLMPVVVSILIMTVSLRGEAQDALPPTDVLLAPLGVETDVASDAIRAQVRSYRFTTLSVEIPAKIDQFAVLQGEQVKEGDLLVTLDCGVQREQRRVASANVAARLASLRADQELVRRGAAGRIKVDLSNAEYSAARGELAALDATLANCEIAAPYDGLVVQKMAQAHQFVSPGDPLMELVDTTALEVDLVVPSHAIVTYGPGASFKLDVEETGDLLIGQIDRLGGIVDPVSQTVRMIGRLEGPVPGNVLPGMSGFLEFTADQ